MNTAKDAQLIRRAFYDMAIDKSRFTPDVLDRYAADAQRPGAMTGMLNWYRAAFRLQGKLAGPWPMIETPTLIVWGEEDAALGIELLEGTDAYVPHPHHRDLPRVSHWVQQEAPERSTRSSGVAHRRPLINAGRIWPISRGAMGAPGGAAGSIHSNSSISA